MKIRILVKKKEGVLDIEGKAIHDALNKLGMKEVSNVFKGSFFEIDFSGIEAEAPKFVETACAELLVNDVIESYTYEILK